MTNRHLKPAPDPEKDRQARCGAYIMIGELLLTEHEWNGGVTPTDAQLEQRRRETGHTISTGTARFEPMPEAPPSKPAQIVQLRAAAPIRARCDQADMSDTPLFGQGSLL